MFMFYVDQLQFGALYYCIAHRYVMICNHESALVFRAAQDLASQAQGLAQTAGDAASSRATGLMKWR